MLKKLSKIEGPFQLPPDVESLAKALFVACLARGRSEIYPVPRTGLYGRMVQWLRDLGYELHREGDALIIEGQGLKFVPHIECIENFGLWPSFDLLWLNLLSFHFPQMKLPCARPSLAHLRLCMPWCDWHYEEGQLHWSPRADYVFSPTLTYAKSRPEARDAQVLRALLEGRSLQIEESHSLRDQWMNLLLHAGASVEHERTGLNLDDLDEVERRMLRKKGIKTDRKSIWKWNATQVLRPLKLKLGGDLSLASALALVATLMPGSSAEIKDVCATPSRIGFVSCLKKLGAQVEWTSKREKSGEAIAHLKVKYARQLQGRKLSGEQVQGQGPEFALLCALAALIPEEVILRDLPEWLDNSPDLIEKCAHNLRQTGAEMGIYDEGLIFQGREQLDGGDFDLGQDLSLNLALQILSLRLHGKSNLSASVDLAEIWPDFWTYFDGAQDAHDQ